MDDGECSTITVLATTYSNQKQYLKTKWYEERVGIQLISYVS